ncbi:MAG TPA: inositol monophosphatase family protein [Miltoncostaeaceae bacterium]|nr:inositol monophosphatase family protein [Miltoncostaeaceae bacterium]
MSAELLEVALAAALPAGALLLERSRGPATGLSAKSSRTDLVSDADRAAEELIARAILDARPRDALVAEEGAAADGGSGVRWYVDPLDGTINFLWGVPHWCVSVAAYDDEGGLVGVVHDPNRGETFTAARGAGARLDGRPIAVRPPPPLSEALVATGFEYTAEARARQARLLTAVLPAVRDVRRFGAAALDLCWVAAGRFDGYFETGLKPWDRAAGEMIVREAGGAVEDSALDGVIAGHPAVVADLRGLVAGG